MKKLFVSVLLSMFLGMGLHVSAQNAQTVTDTQEQTAETKTVTINIVGMHCGGCARKIHTLLQKQKGYVDDDVAFPGTGCVITYDPTATTEKALVRAVKNAGYKVEVVEPEGEEG